MDKHEMEFWDEHGLGRMFKWATGYVVGFKSGGAADGI